MPATTPERGAPAKKTILIVDDDPMLRRGVATPIESVPDLAVCGEAATCQAAIEIIWESPPDLVVFRDGLPTAA